MRCTRTDAHDKNILININMYKHLLTILLMHLNRITTQIP